MAKKKRASGIRGGACGRLSYGKTVSGSPHKRTVCRKTNGRFAKQKKR